MSIDNKKTIKMYICNLSVTDIEKNYQKLEKYKKHTINETQIYSPEGIFKIDQGKNQTIHYYLASNEKSISKPDFLGIYNVIIDHSKYIIVNATQIPSKHIPLCVTVNTYMLSDDSPLRFIVTGFYETIDNKECFIVHDYYFEYSIPFQNELCLEYIENDGIAKMEFDKIIGQLYQNQ